MKINLVTLAAFPYKSAESIHLASFSKAMNSACDFTLVTPAKPWRPETFGTNTEPRYGIRRRSFVQRKHIQVTRSGEGFCRSAVRAAKRRGALVYARHALVIAEAIRQHARCAWEIHSMPNSQALAILADALTSGLLRKVFTISDALRHDLTAALGGLRNESIIVARDAADATRFSATCSNRDTPRVGYVGSAYPGKGVEVIVPLARICPEIDFLLYGMENRELEGRFGALPPNLEVRGRVDYAEIPAALHEFDIALLPNQRSVIMDKGDDIGKYTSPMKLFEYMASGKAIVASDLPVIREVLDGHYDSVLVPHDDVGLWADAVRGLVGCQDTRVRIAAGARARFLDQYTYEARAKLCVDALT